MSAAAVAPGGQWAAALGAEHAGMIVATTAPAPTPSPSPGGYSEPWEVTPGLGGFLAFFVLGVALAVLARFLTRSVRRIDHASGHRPTAPVPEGGIARPGESLVDDPARDARADRRANGPDDGGSGARGSGAGSSGARGDGRDRHRDRPHGRPGEGTEPPI